MINYLAFSSPGWCDRLRLRALAAGLRHNAEIGQPGRSLAVYAA